ncbi:PTS system mannose/fructose/sorbose family transporter subunit IID [Pseudoflavonifractor sp. MSJ-37]|uniref:PTS system mannose/fructose/sorbose family transporter subunit IID n=1 Tax=Pseudoflavonifractor sp. MSJ-37 TaxID=2841531 RepID=UPI001C0FA494|nr:PTS system mannose/fructose/sorbose family transporter subunit IID [Pseudoflavonifractor sp. MSJ-37]MBU5435078.1 PTS system mannose/fructose/sorbose family transporter subunit IID [Pseudoflavonifractor sp. MSJ-37]
MAANVENSAVQEEKRMKLTKKDVQKSYWLWQFFSHANYNYERMQGGAFAACMAPIIEKLYPNKEDRVAGLQRHLTFFNTNPNVGTVIHGAVISMEEERANGAEISDEAINAVKTGMMGPFAGIGDALDQGVIIPLIVALGISFGQTGNLFGPLLVLIGIPLALMLIAYNCWMKGYSLGSSAITSMLAGGRMKQIIGAAGILGCTVMGGLIATSVSLKTAIAFNIGDEAFDLQAQLFDAIMPNLLPLAVTLGVYALLRKEKFTSIQIMLGIIVICFVGGLVGIF